MSLTKDTCYADQSTCHLCRLTPPNARATMPRSTYGISSKQRALTSIDHSHVLLFTTQDLRLTTYGFRNYGNSQRTGTRPNNRLGYGPYLSDFNLRAGWARQEQGL